MELVARLKSLATDNQRNALVAAASAVLVLLIAVTLAQLVWLVIEGVPVADVQSSPSSQTITATPARQYTPEMAKGWRLFGDATAGAPTAGGESAPVTNLSLQLLGTFSTGNDRLAGAVIAEHGKEGELFRIGAAVPGGAVLEKVEADRVLLRRRGQLETLRFEELPAAGAAAGAETGKGLDMAGGFRGLKDRLLRPPPGDAAEGEAASRARTVLGNLATDLKDNPEGVLNELGLKPAAAGGGYLVGEGSSADVMRGLGLRQGDVILSVNGKPLGNVQNDTRLVDEVKASGEARVEIRRGSQTFTVNYPL